MMQSCPGIDRAMHVSKVFKRQLGSATYREDRRQARQKLRDAGIYERITVWERPKADLDEDMFYVTCALHANYSAFHLQTRQLSTLHSQTRIRQSSNAPPIIFVKCFFERV